MKETAEQPEGAAQSQVSLDVLQDTGVQPQKPIWRRHLAKAAVLLVGLALVAGGYATVTGFKLLAHKGTVASSPPRVQEPAKATQAETMPPSVDRSAFSKPIQELMQYVDDLKQGKVAFSAGMPGDEAAKQLGFTRLFASAYDEMTFRAKSAQNNQKRLRAPDIVAGFEQILSEEQAIDRLQAKRDRNAAVIAFLRALQNGDVVFPIPQDLAPTPQVLLMQLTTAYPGVSLDIDDPTFAAIYRATRDFADSRVKAAGEIWAQEIIAEFRHRILASATASDGSQTVCAQGKELGEMVVFTELCPHLDLGDGPKKSLEEIARNDEGTSCQRSAASEFRNKLKELSGKDVIKICEAVEEQVRLRKFTAFRVIN